MFWSPTKQAIILCSFFISVAGTTPFFLLVRLVLSLGASSVSVASHCLRLCSEEIGEGFLRLRRWRWVKLSEVQQSKDLTWETHPIYSC
jgi:hypothetical protein